MRSEGSGSAGISVGKIDAGQLFACRAYIDRTRCEVAEFAFEAGRPGVKCAVPKGAVNAAEVEGADDAVGSERGNVLLIAVNIHHRVGTNRLGVSVGKDIDALRSVGSGELGGSDLKPVGNGRIGGGLQARVNDKGSGAGEEVILPDIGLDGSYSAAGMDSHLVCNLPGCLDTRSPGVPGGLVAGLGVDDILLRATHREEAAGAVSALGNRCVEFPTEAVVEGEAGRDFPGVLEIRVDVVATDGGGADVGTV